MTRFAVMLAVAVVLNFPDSLWAQCPPYTHKDNVVLGTPAALPDGWCVYAKPGTPGLFRSNIRTFSETIVSGSAAHSPTCIDISPDGAWVVYLDSPSASIYVLPSAGGTPIRVPVNLMVPHAVLGPHMTGFRRGLASGLEIFYNAFVFANPGQWQDTSLMITTPVSFSGSGAAFGTPNLIANLPATMIWGFSGSFAIWNDQIFGIFRYPPNGYTMNGFVTIPNTDSGIAGEQNVYRFSDSPTESYWGCGQTISHDGLYCASNSRNIGHPTCVPNQESTPAYDHKGIYITKFLRQGVDPAIRIDDQIMNPAYGRSINWCPVNYRQGTYEQCEFTDWNFSNHNAYLIGVSKGTRIALYGLSNGLWVLHWPDNTWTQITPPTTTVEYAEPALYYTGLNAVTPGSSTHPSAPARTDIVRVTVGGKLSFLSGHTSLTVYDPAGRRVYSYRRPGTQAGAVLELPKTLRCRTLLVTFQP